jgi:hypothetical protein
MGKLDDAENMDLSERAEELAAEAKAIRVRFATPGEKRTDRAKADKTLSDSLRTFRRIAGR